MNVLEKIQQVLSTVLGWFQVVWDSITNVAIDALIVLWGEFLEFSFVVLNAVPIPGALANFEWPTLGPWAGILIEAGLPEGMAIISAAFAIKMAMRLTFILR